MKKLAIKKTLIFTIIFSLLVVFDQYTKHLANIHLKGNKPFVIIKDIFELYYLDGGNTGAAWGIMSGNTLFLTIVPGIVCLLLIVLIYRIEMYIAYAKTKEWYTNKINLTFTSLQTFLVILIAGAVGNLIDRVTNHYVVDFFYFKLIDFPIFNVADCYVTVTMFLIIITFMFFITEGELSYIMTCKTDGLTREKEGKEKAEKTDSAEIK